MNKQQLEKKYGIKIVDDSFISPMSGRYVKQYKMYSADGCPWENGLKTLVSVERECRQWEKELLAIKAKAGK